MFSVFVEADSKCRKFATNVLPDRSQKISEEKTREILKTLSDLRFPPLLEEAQNVIQENSGIAGPEEFFYVLMSRVTERVSQFDRNQLIDVLYVFKELEVTPSTEFIKMWRISSFKQLRSFSSLDRYYIVSFFNYWKIPQLMNPFDVNSSPVQREKML